MHTPDEPDERDLRTAEAVSEPRPSDPIQTNPNLAIEADLAAGPYRAERKRFAGSAHKPQVVRMENTGHLALVKVDSQVPTLGRQMVRNEVAAYRLAQALGIDLVPPTVHRLVRHGDLVAECSFQLMVEGEDRGDVRGVPNSEVADGAAFDIAIGQQDRLIRNWIVRKDAGGLDRLVLIDHGCAFDFRSPNSAYLARNPHGDARTLLLEEAGRRGLSPSHALVERLLDPASPEWTGVESLLTKEQVAGVMRRIREARRLSA
jgi:hypothetical protein